MMMTSKSEPWFFDSFDSTLHLVRIRPSALGTSPSATHTPHPKSYHVLPTLLQLNQIPIRPSPDFDTGTRRHSLVIIQQSSPFTPSRLIDAKPLRKNFLASFSFSFLFVVFRSIFRDNPNYTHKWWSKTFPEPGQLRVLFCFSHVLAVPFCFPSLFVFSDPNNRNVACLSFWLWIVKPKSGSYLAWGTIKW